MAETVNRFYAGVAPSYILIARAECPACGAHANWPHALRCYDAAQRKRLEKNIVGRCF